MGGYGNHSISHWVVINRKKLGFLNRDGSEVGIDVKLTTLEA